MSTPDPSLARSLQAALPDREFVLVCCRPGSSFVQDARRACPQIAVIDRIHERHTAVQMEIAVLKDCRADVRIILLSQEPSPADAALVEQGVFFYLSDPSLPNLIAVLQAAAASLQREAARLEFQSQ